MTDRKRARIEAVEQLAAIFAAAYLRHILPPSSNKPVDCPKTQSESCGGRLTQ